MEESRKKLFAQIYKFVIIGALNTAIDFGVLNLLMWWTGIYSGNWIILLNMISFSVAVTNSYFWNKYWTFKAKEEGENRIKEFSQYVAVTLVGLVLNTAAVYLITTFIPPMFGTSKELWANLAKVVATGISLIWNFLGYKFIVFRK